MFVGLQVVIKFVMLLESRIRILGIKHVNSDAKIYLVTYDLAVLLPFS